MFQLRFQIKQQLNNPKWTTGFRFVKNTDASTYVRPTPIRKFLPRDLDNFWRYHGSFDRPLATVTDSIPLFCQEAVAWTIFKASRKSYYTTFSSSLMLCFAGTDRNIRAPVVWVLSVDHKLLHSGPSGTTFEQHQEFAGKKWTYCGLSWPELSHRYQNNWIHSTHFLNTVIRRWMWKLDSL